MELSAWQTAYRILTRQNGTKNRRDTKGTQYLTRVSTSTFDLTRAQSLGRAVDAHQQFDLRREIVGSVPPAHGPFVIMAEWSTVDISCGAKAARDWYSWVVQCSIRV